MAGEREVTGAMRGVFLIGGAFVLVAGFQLYVLSEETDDFFAWTIEPPLTAAFLGAFYFGAGVLALGSYRTREWDCARVGVPGVIAFVWLMLAATLIHLDKFHLDDAALVPAIAAWAWLAIYALEPPFLLWAYPRQLRAPGADKPCEPDVPRLLRGGFRAIGAVFVAVGLALFAAPGTRDEIWPWELTPLTAQACGAWAVGQGIVLVTIAREGCWARVRWAVAGLAVLAILVAVALARYPDSFDWNSLPGVIFVAVLAAILLGSVYGGFAGRRAR